MLTKTNPEPDLFSYAALSREDEASAREDAALVRSNSEDIARKGIDIGRALNRQHVKMPHGMWTSYLRDECHLSERSAQVLMKAARDVETNPKLNAYLTGGAISVAAIDLMFARTTPAEVRDRVDELLVDGQKVTVADIRKMKAEAKQAVDRAEALAERNADLARKTPEPALIETIVERPAESEARIRELEDRIRRLSEANTQRATENASLREKLEQKSAPVLAAALIDPPNVIRPSFGLSEHEGDPDRFETGDLTDEDSIDAFSGALGSMETLKIEPKDFWKRQGKKTVHGKRVHQALLNVNAIIGLLIKEHAK